MAQGNFKTKPPVNTHKTKRSSSPRTRRREAIHREVVHRKNTSSHAAALEKSIAVQAMSHGKLTIMRGPAEEEKKAKDGAKK
ncbi:SPOSA6832_04366 [Sporobolomyces salmonicolor]|uniref:SPOSA6832_04366-mRNA-1:cds n=1 Tax=Sporidiobolus salmonicolor TaxID=5005 RepID=A0A0D6ESI4_SPOSA|nr:SPOSA6832_04366 [Sporobolomyces salmonicolor]